MRNKHQNLNHYVFFKCEIFSSLTVENPPLLLPIQILCIPEDFPWPLFCLPGSPKSQPVPKAVLDWLLDSVLFHGVCLFPHEWKFILLKEFQSLQKQRQWCLQMAWLGIYEKVKYPWHCSGNPFLPSLFTSGYTIILRLDCWFCLGLGAMAWLGWTIWQMNSRL